MPRQLLHSLTGLILTALTGAGTALTIPKVLRDEAWTGLDFYSVPEEWALIAMVITGITLALAAPLFALVLFAHWWRRRDAFSSAPRASKRQVVRLPMVVVAWYVISGACLFSLDASFTRRGGTTPFCYDHPVLFVYQPVVSTLFRLGWHGGGRYTRAYMDDSWRGRPIQYDAPGPAAYYFRLTPL